MSMRAFSELLGRLVVWVTLLWLGAILLAPRELRPALACRPLVWLTRSLADIARGAASDAVQALPQGDVLDHFSQGCSDVMRQYLNGGVQGGVQGAVQGSVRHGIPDAATHAVSEAAGLVWDDARYSVPART